MIGKKIMALVIVGGLTASIGMTAGAYTKGISTKAKINITQTQKLSKPALRDGQNGIKTRLDALVKAGTITQTVEDKLITYINAKEAALKAEMDKVKSMTPADRKTYMETKIKTVKTDLATDLVKSGTLTQAEVDALKAALPKLQGPMGFKGRGLGKGMMQGFGKSVDMQQVMKTKLDTLVTGGTLTQATEDSVIAYFKQEQAARKVEMDKVKAMSAADRKAYMASKVKGQKTAPLASLVSNGTLTQAQADAITKLLPVGQKGHGRKGGFGGRH